MKSNKCPKSILIRVQLFTVKTKQYKKGEKLQIGKRYLFFGKWR